MGPEEKQIHQDGPTERRADSKPNAFDIVFEQALTDHDRLILWLCRVWVDWTQSGPTETNG